MATLYDLTEALKGFEYEFDDDGVWTNEAELDELNVSRDEKIQNCLYVIKNAKADAEMYDAEIRKLKLKKERAEKSADRLKDYVSFCLQGEKWSKDDCPLKVSYHTSHPLIMREEIAEHPENYLPSAYINHDEKWTAKKEAIKDAIKRGQIIDGCSIGENKTLVIR